MSGAHGEQMLQGKMQHMSHVQMPLGEGRPDVLASPTTDDAPLTGAPLTARTFLGAAAILPLTREFKRKHCKPNSYHRDNGNAYLAAQECQSKSGLWLHVEMICFR